MKLFPRILLIAAIAAFSWMSVEDGIAIVSPKFMWRDSLSYGPPTEIGWPLLFFDSGDWSLTALLVDSLLFSMIMIGACLWPSRRLTISDIIAVTVVVAFLVRDDQFGKFRHPLWEKLTVASLGIMAWAMYGFVNSIGNRISRRRRSGRWAKPFATSWPLAFVFAALTFLNTESLFFSDWTKEAGWPLVFFETGTYTIWYWQSAVEDSLIALMLLGGTRAFARNCAHSLNATALVGGVAGISIVVIHPYARVPHDLALVAVFSGVYFSALGWQVIIANVFQEKDKESKR